MVKLQPNCRHEIQVEKLHCFACHHRELVALPVPHPARAVISDGRAFPRTLQKVACPACGLVSHAQPPGPGIVRQFYSESFDLGQASGKAEHQRAEVGGSFLVLDCMTFHSGGANRTQTPRRAVNHIYSLPFVKQQINLQTLFEGRELPARTKKLFNFDNGAAADVSAYYERRRATLAPVP
jgi:hypothetical protein